MKLSLQKILLILTLLLMPSFSAKAQDASLDEIIRFEGFNFGFTGNGARARGMGNAFLAVSDDITGVGWNPAGIYKIESPILGLSFGSLRPRGSSSSDKLDLSGASPAFERITRNHAGTFGSLNSANLVAPIRIKGHPFVASASYTRVSNEYEFSNIEFDQIQIFSIFNEVAVLIDQDTVIASIGVISELEGGIDAVNFGFGTRLSGNFALGISLNIYGGAVQRHTNFLVTGDNVPVNNFQNGFSETSIVSADSSGFGGFNFTIGFKHDGERFDAGLVIKTPFSLSQKSLNFTSAVVKVNDVVSFTDTTITIDLLTKYEIPVIVGFGIGYNVSDSWLLALDAEYRHFSAQQIKIRQNITLVPGADNIEEFLILSEQQWQWSNVFILRAGTEYLNETGIGTIPFRAGIGYVPVPTPDTDINGVRSTAVGYEFSLGTGIHWEQIKLDLAYNYSTLSLERLGFAAQSNNKNHFLTASFTGYF